MTQISKRRKKEVLSTPERQVLVALSNLVAAKDGLKPEIQEIREEMVRLNFKPLSDSRIYRHVAALKDKGKIRLTERAEIVEVPA